MPKLSTCQLADVLARIGSIEPLDSQVLAGQSPDDLFVCALGFEPRCLTLPERLASANYRAARAIYLTYATNLDDNRTNLTALETHLGSIAGEVEQLDADAAEFPTRFRSLLELVSSTAKPRTPRVVFDISVAANRFVMRCMKFLLEFEISLRIIYSEAEIYHPTKLEYDNEPSKWQRDDLLGLERGVSEVAPSVEYPGNALDPQPDFVILFPSFRPERSMAVVNFVDPSLVTSPQGKVVWLLGMPHLEEDRWRIEAMRKINAIDSNTPQYDVSTFDYKDTVRVLESIYQDKSGRHTITLSPLGSKMQALGSAIYCYMHPDVRIIFSVPKEYNAVQYSKGCKAVWQIDFGSLCLFTANLDEVGTLRIDE